MSGRAPVTVLSTLALVVVSACSPAEQPDLEVTESEPAPAAAPVEDAEMAPLLAAAERYTDVETALADGYLRDPADMCVTAAMEGQPAELGAMGIHFFKPDLLQITAMEPRVAGTGTHTDWEQPGVLIYEPRADGSLALVAVENLVFQAGWAAAGHTAPPSFMGQEYVTMVDDPATEADEAHGMEPHYELHAWVAKDNPAGTFAPFNPTVTCEHHTPAPEPMPGH